MINLWNFAFSSHGGTRIPGSPKSWGVPEIFGRPAVVKWMVWFRENPKWMRTGITWGTWVPGLGDFHRFPDSWGYPEISMHFGWWDFPWTKPSREAWGTPKKRWERKDRSFAAPKNAIWKSRLWVLHKNWWFNMSHGGIAIPTYQSCSCGNEDIWKKLPSCITTTNPWPDSKP